MPRRWREMPADIGTQLTPAFVLIATGPFAGLGLLANTVDSIGRIGRFRGNVVLVTDEPRCAEATLFATSSASGHRNSWVAVRRSRSYRPGAAEPST